jgi:hypothetical protein
MEERRAEICVYSAVVHVTLSSRSVRATKWSARVKCVVG